MTSSTIAKTDATPVGRRPHEYRLPAAAHIGRVRLAVSDLVRSLAFYRDIIGLAVLEPGTPQTPLARLGAHGDSRVLLELEQLPGVQPIGRRTRLGLYHTAFLLASRRDLSAFIQHLAARNFPFGSADHEVSEALYLVDPDGLSVEVYADRPRAEWRVQGGRILGGSEPLRFNSLPAVAKDAWQGAPAATTVGHMHFYVDDLTRAAAFYRTGMGLDETVTMPSALFMSAGGYHHHVGVNLWAAGSPLATAHDARILFWELALPDTAEIGRVAASMTAAGFVETFTAVGARAFADPCGITVALVA